MEMIQMKDLEKEFENSEGWIMWDPFWPNNYSDLNAFYVKIKQSFGIKLTPDENWNY